MFLVPEDRECSIFTVLRGAPDNDPGVFKVFVNGTPHGEAMRGVGRLRHRAAGVPAVRERRWRVRALSAPVGYPVDGSRPVGLFLQGGSELSSGDRHTARGHCLEVSGL